MRRVKYRTQDNLEDYEFAFKEMRNGSWRAYILKQPSYQGRNTNGEITHRHTSLTGPSRHYICWTGKLKSESQARKVAAQWADATQLYIKNGKTF